MRAVVLIPVKGFQHAKGRLAERLSSDQRSKLARLTATAVVRAAAPLPAAVVCDDDEVAEWAADVGARVLRTTARGLNPSVTDAVGQLAAAGFDHVIIAHGDLPLAAGLADLATPGLVTLVPDGDDEGTNVLSLPIGTGFAFSYGPGSFQRHRDEASRLALPTRVRRIAHLALDVDTPADLDHPLLQEVLSSLQTNQANPV